MTVLGNALNLQPTSPKKRHDIQNQPRHSWKWIEDATLASADGRW